jgi:hypothetical protein
MSKDEALSLLSIRKLAEALDSPAGVLVEQSFSEANKVIAFVGTYASTAHRPLAVGPAARYPGESAGDDQAMEVYYTTGKVKTSLDHPTQGKTVLFRGYELVRVTSDELRDIFVHPRIHTDKSWRTHARREGLEAKAAAGADLVQQ